jgi:hypothetical protein
MPFNRLSILIVLAALLGQSLPQRASSQAVVHVPKLDFHAPDGDPFANGMRDEALASVQQIESFFGAPFPEPVHFKVVADRAGFDEAVAKYGLSPTQCWMVGMGTADVMVVLSPEAWTKQACEHDAKDLEATRLLIKHELIHVYHGQFNPTRDFTGVDDLDWFIEGLAVFGSGQLTKDRLDALHTAVAQGQTPTELSKIWTGPNRYGFAGSLVGYVDAKWGRATTVRLLKVKSTAEALAILGTDEKALLNGWRASLGKS